MPDFRLRKSEKLCSQTGIDALFAHSGKGAIAYPVRMVWREAPEGRIGAPVQFLISVPKKKLRHAVDRVTIRRRIREAYRLNRALIPVTAEEGNTVEKKFNVAFVYLAPELQPYRKIEAAIKRLLPKLC